MTSHSSTYQITGRTVQTAEITLSPGETVVAEAGTIVYMDEGISSETCLGDGSEPNQGIMGKLFPTESKFPSTETLFLTYFTNYGRGSRKIVFATPYAGSIERIDLSKANNEIVVQRNSFICGPKGLKLQPYTYLKSTAGPRGDVLPLQKLQGSGEVLVSIGGTLVERDLASETIFIEASSLVAFQPTISLAIDPSNQLKTMLLGNAAITLVALSGSGKVWMQSLPLKKQIQTITTYIHQTHLTENKPLGKLYEE